MRLPPAGIERALRPDRAFDVRTAIGLTVGGLPAVLIAALVVKSLPLYARRSRLN